MTEVGISDIAAALRRLGVQGGDTVMYHGSMKSMGHVNGGAAALIDGVLASAPEVTAAMATLWYDGHPENFREQDFDLRNSPAWNGAMAEAMRKDPRSVRSRHWTHSVSAVGPRAVELTAGHGLGKRYPTPWSEAAFSEISPWSRLYEWNALYVFFGVTMRCCTMKHWIESRYVAAFLEQFPPEKYTEKRNELMHECKPGIRFLFNAEPFQKHLEEAGLVVRTTLGDAQVLAIRTRVLVDETMRALAAEPEKYFPEEFVAWMNRNRKELAKPDSKA